MSRVFSALCISCESGTDRPLANVDVHPIFLRFRGESAARKNGDFRRDDELDDEYETRGVAGVGRGAAVCRTGKGDGAGRLQWRASFQWRAKRCANSGGCDEVAREQEIQRRK